MAAVASRRRKPNPDRIAANSRQLYYLPLTNLWKVNRRRMDERLKMVIDTVRTLTRENKGVVIEPIDSPDGVLRISYYEGTNEECPECVLSSDSFREMVLRMCQVQVPHITSVEIIPAE